MKKFLALTLVILFVLTGVFVVACNHTPDDEPENPDNQTPGGDGTTTQNKLYLVPGTYMVEGNKVENTISSDATKLTQAECDEIFMDNVYLCTLAVGSTLPIPQTSRVDGDGKTFVFNGWWAIVNATVTYFDKVPLPSVAKVLYADWRADLSQRRDPVQPGADTETSNNHYMEIKRATGEVEKIKLSVSGTDQSSAEHLGYASAVQLYNGFFELNPGDIITVYTVGLKDEEEAVAAPIYSEKANRNIMLESAGDGSNVTSDYLKANFSSYWRDIPTLQCIAETTRNYRIYIKFYSGGASMTVYMEPMD